MSGSEKKTCNSLDDLFTEFENVYSEMTKRTDRQTTNTTHQNPFSDKGRNDVSVTQPEPFSYTSSDSEGNVLESEPMLPTQQTPKQDQNQEESQATDKENKEINDVNLTPQQREFYSTGYVTSKKGKAPMNMKKGVYPFKTSVKLHDTSVRFSDEQGGGQDMKSDLKQITPQAETTNQLQAPTKHDQKRFLFGANQDWGDIARKMEEVKKFLLHNVWLAEELAEQLLVNEWNTPEETPPPPCTEPPRYKPSGCFCCLESYETYEPIEMQTYSYLRDEPPTFAPTILGVMTMQKQFSFSPDEVHQWYKDFMRCSIAPSLTGRLNTHEDKIYSNIPCVEHSRVKLRDLTGCLEDDFIHANFVDGYKRSGAYICCQAPLPNTCLDFWTMVWQEECRVIVAMESIDKRDKRHVGRYWPKFGEQPKVFNPFTIYHTATNDCGYYILTTLQVEFTLHQCRECRTIYHIENTVPQVICASQVNTPEYLSTIYGNLFFLWAVRFYQLKATTAIIETWQKHFMGPPMVVHCSDGVTLTGLFVVLDICVAMIDDAKRIKFDEIVLRANHQRAMVLHQWDLYLLSYKTLYEHSKFRKLCI